MRSQISQILRSPKWHDIPFNGEGEMNVTKIKRRGIHQINHRTSLLVGGKQRKSKSGVHEIFTILTASHGKKDSLKVLVPNRNPVGELYRIFPQLQPGEKPVNGFTCALHKDILLQGRIVICTNCICFHSNIFGYETRLIIYFKNVVAIRREKTAFVVPNAISVRTFNKRYLFCSFLSRESVFKLLLRIWKGSINYDGINSSPKDDIITTEIVKSEYRDKRIDSKKNMLVLKSSMSYDPSSRYSMNQGSPRRPHSSPPCLYNIFFTSDIDIRGIDWSNSEEVDEYNYCVNDKSYSVESPSKALFMFPPRKLFKSNTLGDLRELKSLQQEVGAEKISMIEKNLMYAQKKEDSLFSSEKSSLLSYAVNILERFFNFFNWLRVQPSSIFCLLFLFLLLVSISFSLLIRINSISNSIQKEVSTEYPAYDDDQNIRMHHLFQYQDDVHYANVQRMKRILCTNIETVNEVQQALRKLREKLQ